MTALLRKSIAQARRLTIAVIGFTVLLLGIAMLVLPGPALIVIPVGLGILSTEFIWAKSLLRKVKATILKNRTGGKLNETK
jgi:uncharacterized protein (TIGR02611 family)